MSVIERALDKLRHTPGARPVQVSTVASTQRRQAASAPAGTKVEPRVFIDRQALRDAGYLPESGQDRLFADEYRQIKRPLIATAFDPAGEVTGNTRLIMMASALPGDGKTFTSINLALSMARERDTSVVLVDADVAKPHVSQIFGVDKEPGLLDALVDESRAIEELVLPTDVRGLSILPAGSRRETASELLASDRMRALADELLASDPGRLLLFDTSPLLVSSESTALVGIAGQILLVVRSGKTPRRAVLDALACIEPGKAVSLVLNQGRRSLVGDAYGYSKYGNYGHEADEPG
jgi:exopolysaccharide/PEP-CTERM locus tyrosine autokinase